MGRAWARNILEGDQVQIAGWVDVLEGKAEAARQEMNLGQVETSTDLHQVLRSQQPDFVVDATVPESHCEVTIAALEMGCSVLGEKPMAHTMSAARQMVHASERAGKLYMVSQSRRYDARIHSYRQLVSELGSLGMAHVEFYLGPHFGGFRDQMASPLVLDMAIHTFDQARFILKRDAVRVFCEEFNPPWSWYQGDACAQAIFEMEDGVRLAYLGSWCSQGLATSWEGSWRTVGERGTAVWDGGDRIEAEFVEAQEGFIRNGEQVSRGYAREGFRWGISGALDEFLWALETGHTPNGECHDNIQSLAMVFGCIESAKRRGWVSIAEVLGA